jgi:flagellar biosynthesis protein FliQ
VNGAELFDAWRQALITAATVVAPLLLAILAVGLLISVIQAATQLSENVLTFVPKLVVLGLVLALSGSWLVAKLADYTRGTAERMVQVGREGRHQ